MHEFVKPLCVCLLVLFLNSALADGMPVPTSQDASPPAEFINHSSITLTDGRVLVAGGMPTSINHPDQYDTNQSRIWDPETGQWKTLDSELNFDDDQKAYLNQLADGRILFFVTREQTGKPEYLARIWDPRSNRVDKLAVSATAKPGTDVAVMTDGRVLLVNSSEGSADVWDGLSNTVVHRDVALLKDSRWRALPLTNKNVLLIETFSDEVDSATTTRKKSSTILWDTTHDKWRQLGDFPVLFKAGSSLIETEDGAIQASVAGGEKYQLKGDETSWNTVIKDIPAIPAAQPDMASAPSVSAPARNPSALVHAVSGGRESGEATHLEILERIQTVVVAFPLLWLIALYYFVRDAGKIIRGQRPVSMPCKIPPGDAQPETAPGENKAALAAFCLIAIPIVTYAVYVHQSGRLDDNGSECIDQLVRLYGNKQDPVIRAKQWVQCVDGKNSFLESIVFRKTRNLALSIPPTPCRYIGEWGLGWTRESFTSDFDGTILTLTDDNRFVATAVNSGPPFYYASFIGAWGVDGDDLILLYDKMKENSRGNKPGFVHVLHIIPESRSRFTVEGGAFHGPYTFNLIDAIKSNNCTL